MEEYIITLTYLEKHNFVPIKKFQGPGILNNRRM